MHTLLLATACGMRTIVACYVAVVFLCYLATWVISLSLCFHWCFWYLWLWCLLAPVGLAFSGLHPILLFRFWGMCWLGLHVHCDNPAVVAMLSRWSARPVCVLRCHSFIRPFRFCQLSIIIFWCIQCSCWCLAIGFTWFHLPFAYSLAPIASGSFVGIDRVDRDVHGYLECGPPSQSMVLR